MNRWCLTLHNGFENVYHLEGGIIKHANDVKQQGLANKFRGVKFRLDGVWYPIMKLSTLPSVRHPTRECTNCAYGCHLLFNSMRNVK